MTDSPSYSLVAHLSTAELAAVRRFATQAERLAHRSFFRTTSTKVTISVDESGLRVSHNLPDDEALSAALPVFRQLYAQGETANAGRVINHISGAAHRAGTEVGREIIALVKGHKRVLRQLNEGSPAMGLVHNGSALTNTDLITYWLYGDQIHWDPEKAAVLEAWPSGLLYQPLVWLLDRYARIYWNLGNLARLTIDMSAATPPMPDNQASETRGNSAE